MAPNKIHDIFSVHNPSIKLVKIEIKTKISLKTFYNLFKNSGKYTND